jgi:hypothetical protein
MGLIVYRRRAAEPPVLGPGVCFDGVENAGRRLVARLVGPGMLELAEGGVLSGGGGVHAAGPGGRGGGIPAVAVWMLPFMVREFILLVRSSPMAGGGWTGEKDDAARGSWGAVVGSWHGLPCMPPVVSSSF